jgi:hypothetical protein
MNHLRGCSNLKTCRPSSTSSRRQRRSIKCCRRRLHTQRCGLHSWIWGMWVAGGGLPTIPVAMLPRALSRTLISFEPAGGWCSAYPRGLWLRHLRILDASSYEYCMTRFRHRVMSWSWWGLAKQQQTCSFGWPRMLECRWLSLHLPCIFVPESRWLSLPLLCIFLFILDYDVWHCILWTLF